MPAGFVSLYPPYNATHGALDSRLRGNDKRRCSRMLPGSGMSPDSFLLPQEWGLRGADRDCQTNTVAAPSASCRGTARRAPTIATRRVFRDGVHPRPGVPVRACGQRRNAFERRGRNRAISMERVARPVPWDGIGRIRGNAQPRTRRDRRSVPYPPSSGHTNRPSPEASISCTAPPARPSGNATTTNTFTP